MEALGPIFHIRRHHISRSFGNMSPAILSQILDFGLHCVLSTQTYCIETMLFDNTCFDWTVASCIILGTVVIALFYAAITLNIPRKEKKVNITY